MTGHGEKRQAMASRWGVLDRVTAAPRRHAMYPREALAPCGNQLACLARLTRLACNDLSVL